ncbi:MAG: hypothetical protein GVX96_03965 [Bacteroidetes bacterium]|jgi:Mn2+/Fe2+ NRAMP family transporter|nr:hypothetical protein [Bacteroidota bacterium]
MVFNITFSSLFRAIVFFALAVILILYGETYFILSQGVIYLLSGLLLLFAILRFWEWMSSLKEKRAEKNIPKYWED